MNQDLLTTLDMLLNTIQNSTDNELKIIGMKLNIREVEGEINPLEARAYKAVRSLITIEKKLRIEESKEESKAVDNCTLRTVVEETEELVERTDTTPEPAD